MVGLHQGSNMQQLFYWKQAILFQVVLNVWKAQSCVVLLYKEENTQKLRC